MKRCKWCAATTDLVPIVGGYECYMVYHCGKRAHARRENRKVRVDAAIFESAGVRYSFRRIA